MTGHESRNFNCPESEVPCTDKRCSEKHCVAQEKASVVAAEAAARQQRRPDPDLERLILPKVRAALMKHKNSN
jgi:hypothetical protein